MRDWTRPGYERQRLVVEELKRRLRQSSADLRDMRCGHSSGNNNDHADLDAIGESKEQTQNRLALAETLLADIRIAKAPPTNGRGQVGNEFRIRYLDDSSRMKRGEEESFNLGGDGESDVESILRTYSCTSPLGRAVVGKEAGDEATITTPGGESYDIEIVKISTPSAEQVASKAA